LHTEYRYERRHDSEYGDSEKNAFEYVDYVRLRWRLIAVASVSAVVLSFSASMLLPKRYTATASIVIEPPAGNDVRTATAVSPVYLESLRTFERFASSDTLFAGAVEHFHLASGENARSIESLKQQVLKVTKIRDTKILEISATLPEPALAQQLVNYIAEETVKLSRGESAATDREVIGEAERQAAEAQQRLDRAQQGLVANAAREPSGALQPRIESDVDLLEKVHQSLIDARSDIAEYQEKADFARELPGLRARAAELEKRAGELEKGIEQKSALASQRAAERQRLEVEVKMAQTASESSAARLRDLRATAGTRGERLRVIDPGIVPQRPSSPNVALNVFAALLLTLVALVAYLTVLFSYQRRRAA
jgi:succinoglycan biosynthesis transport protein ExoP